MPHHALMLVLEAGVPPRAASQPGGAVRCARPGAGCQPVHGRPLAPRPLFVPARQPGEEFARRSTRSGVRRDGASPARSAAAASPDLRPAVHRPAGSTASSQRMAAIGIATRRGTRAKARMRSARSVTAGCADFAEGTGRQCDATASGRGMPGWPLSTRRSALAPWAQVREQAGAGAGRRWQCVDNPVSIHRVARCRASDLDQARPGDSGDTDAPRATMLATGYAVFGRKCPQMWQFPVICGPIRTAPTDCRLARRMQILLAVVRHP